jgi:hypothetical protein
LHALSPRHALLHWYEQNLEAPSLHGTPHTWHNGLPSSFAASEAKALLALITDR